MYNKYEVTIAKGGIFAVPLIKSGEHCNRWLAGITKLIKAEGEI